MTGGLGVGEFMTGGLGVGESMVGRIGVGDRMGSVFLSRRRSLASSRSLSCKR